MRGFRILGIFLSLLTCSNLAFAVSENEFDKVYEMIEAGPGTFYRHGTFKGVDDVTIHFTRFGGRVSGRKGSIVIAPGRTESSLKYTELAYDLFNQGFSPIFVIDHRGQGLSGRLLKDPEKGHVEDFNHYVQDFAKFVGIVKADAYTVSRRLHLISHSMGGAIAIRYLKDHQDVFRSAVFMAPMFMIALDKSEQDVLNETWQACYLLGRCNEYIPGGGPYTGPKPFTGNDLTNSRIRFDFHHDLWRLYPDMQIGDPTIRWVRESLLATTSVRNYTYLSSIKTPILMFQAQLDKVVNNRGQNEVCSHMRRNCQLLIVRGAKHEILMEQDRLRSAALDRILPFIRR